MPLKIHSIGDIDPAGLKVAAPTRNASGGLNANLLYEGDKLVFTTPKMSCPFGVSSFTDKDNSRAATKYSLDLSFRGMHADPKMAAFHDFLHAVDKTVIDAALANCEVWFNKKMDIAVLRELYSSSVRESQPKLGKDGNPVKYPPMFRAKISYGQTAYNTEAYNPKRQPVNPLDVGKGDSVIGIVEVTGIYFINRRSFGISYRLLQIMVFPSLRIGGTCMIDFTDDAENADEDVAVAEGSPVGEHYDDNMSA